MSEKEKMNVNTAPAVDTSTGTAEDVEAIMKKYDRESNTRIWEGVPKKVVRYLLAAFALLMVYMNLFANWDERVRRSVCGDRHNPLIPGVSGKKGQHEEKSYSHL